MSITQGLCANTNGTLLYAAWKGESGDDRLFVASFDGSEWIGLPQIPGNSSVGPSIAWFDDKLYAIWKGEIDDQRLFYSAFDGSNWQAQQTIPGNSDVGASLAVSPTNGRLYAAWKGELGDERIFYASFDGHSWSNQAQIPGAASSIGPSLAAFDRKLYAAWKGSMFDAANPQSLYYASFDGTTWSGQTAGSHHSQFPSIVASSVGPSLAALGSKLYAAWKGADNAFGLDQGIYYASFDGDAWSGDAPGSSQTQISGVSSSAGPCIAALGDSLYGIWKGEDAVQSMYYASFNGETWSGETPGTPQSPLPGNTGQDFATKRPEGLGGNCNYLMVSACDPVTKVQTPIAGLSVVIDVSEDLIGSWGLGFQINAYSPSGDKCAVQQYIMSLETPTGGTASLYWMIDNWPITGPDLINSGRHSFVSCPAGHLPTGSKLTFSLEEDASHNITGVTFSADVPGASPSQDSVTVPLSDYGKPDDFAPIVAFQVNLVSPVYYGGITPFSTGHTILTSGRGTITYEASTPLAASSYWGPCASYAWTTDEETNSAYGLLPLGTSMKYTQSFLADCTAAQNT